MLRIMAIWLLLAMPPLAEGTTGDGYAVAQIPTPVLNSPDFAGTFTVQKNSRLRTDRCGQIRELEFVALSGTVFDILGKSMHGNRSILRVRTRDYPDDPHKSYYIDSRFVKIVNDRPPDRISVLPDRETILSRLKTAAGTRYIWGGNFRTGIREMIDFFPAKAGAELNGATSSHLKLAGVDCSGLLYEATDGSTPRNTGELLHYGKPLKIRGGTPDSIAEKLLPLDLIVWPGHVLIVLDHDTIIESRLSCDGKKDGVVISPLRQRMAEIFRTRRPVDSISTDRQRSGGEFVVRRWVTEGNDPVPQ